jgi:hypothetical protein
MTRVCSVEGCTDPARQRGWCSKHDFRWYRYGSMEMPASRRPNPGPCSIDGCTRPGPFVRGWCQDHYRTWLRCGDPHAGANQETPDRDCSVPGCDRVARARGLCLGHYDRHRAGMAQRAPGAAFAPFRPRPSQNHRNPCQTEGCERYVYARGLCKKHYSQAYRDTRAATRNGPDG